MTPIPDQHDLLFNTVQTAPVAAPSAAPHPRLLALPCWRTLAPWGVLLLVTLCWDRAVYLYVAVADPAAKAAMEHHGWYITLRSLGTLYPVLGLAVLFLLIDSAAGAQPRRADPLRRAVFLFLCPLLAGGIAELLKPLVGRFKPEYTDGWSAFAGLSDRWSRWSDLGMASSHTAVAFGTAFALSTLLPRGSPLFLAAAVGCAMTRLLAGGHFFSDVYVGILIAYVVARAVRRIDAGNNRGVPIGP
jgi:membrane-associated phospholipid phosphatase